MAIDLHQNQIRCRWVDGISNLPCLPLLVRVRASTETAARVEGQFVIVLSSVRAADSFVSQTPLPVIVHIPPPKAIASNETNLSRVQRFSSRRIAEFSDCVEHLVCSQSWLD